MKQRLAAAGLIQLEEGAYNPSTGELTITVIQPGFNKSKSRYYPATMLKRDYGIFEGAKMFADHQTDAEQKTRPEGSVNNWVASVKKVWTEADGRVRAIASVIDPQFKSKLEELKKQNLLHEMGVSIRAIGEAVSTKVEGVLTNLIESLVKCRSVDFVTYAGAGGMVEAIESQNDEGDVDLITEAELRKRRPDLITIIETSCVEKGKQRNMDTKDEVIKLQQQLAESNTKLADANTKLADANTKLATATTENADLKKKVDESDKAVKKSEVQLELAKQLKESGLPDKAQARIKKQFAESTEVTGIKEAITEEKEYIKSLGVKPSGVKNMGGDDNKQVDESEDVFDDKFIKEMKESYMALGLNEKEAEIAAKRR